MAVEIAQWVEKKTGPPGKFYDIFFHQCLLRL